MHGWLRRIREERGTTSLTISWFMVLAILFAVALDSLFGVFIALQQLRTAGDAAALASTRAVASVMPAAVEAEAARRVDRVVNDPEAQEEIDEAIEELDEAQDRCRENPFCTPLSAAERREAIRKIKIKAYKAAFKRHYPGSLSTKMAEAIVDGDWHRMEAHELRDGLIPDDGDLGCFVRETVQEPAAQNAIYGEAERLAQQNGARLERARSTLMTASGQNRLVVRREVIPFGAAWIFPNGNYPTLSITASVTLKELGSRKLHFPSSC